MFRTVCFDREDDYDFYNFFCQIEHNMSAFMQEIFRQETRDKNCTNTNVNYLFF